MKKSIVFIILVSIFLTSCSNSEVITPKKIDPTTQKSIDTPSFWNKDSKVKITVFTDFECPACIFFEKTIWEKLFSYAKDNKIFLEYKNYPLPFHKNALSDASAVMCWADQWKYKEFATKMYDLEDQKKGLEVTNDERITIAKSLWLDESKFTMCLNEDWFQWKINSEIQDWKNMDLQGTPSIYLNGKIMKFSSEQEFFGIIDAALKL